MNTELNTQVAAAVDELEALKTSLHASWQRNIVGNKDGSKTRSHQLAEESALILRGIKHLNDAKAALLSALDVTQAQRAS